MINEVDQMTIPIILSNASQKAYEKFKKLVLRIFSLLKKNQCKNNLKEEFYDSYIDFARKLDAEGYHEESNLYMSICEMYYRLIDRPDELIDYVPTIKMYYLEQKFSHLKEIEWPESL